MIGSLRIAIVGVDPPRAAALARDARELGHEISSINGPVADLRTDEPDIMLVGRDDGDGACLALVRFAAHELACAPIVILHVLDQTFVESAAANGAFGFLAHTGAPALAAVLAIAHPRRVDRNRLLKAFERRAMIEQAKGILMTRNGISSERAFILLRRHSQRTNRKIVDVSQAVVNSHALLMPSAEGEPATESLLTALWLARQRPLSRQQEDPGGMHPQ
jgi:AmiR/NasT family two-component response regulator